MAQPFLPILTCLLLLATTGVALLRDRLSGGPFGRAKGPVAVWSCYLAALACACIATVEIAAAGGVWHSGLGAALWLIVAACLLCAGPVLLLRRGSLGLLILLCPMLAFLGVAGLLLRGASQAPIAAGWSRWLEIHVAVSLAAFALVTIASVAGLAVLVQTRALKTKSRGLFGGALPSVADAEAVEFALLSAALGLMAVGIATGVAEALVSGRGLLPLDHKTILSVIGFLLIGLVLAVHRLAGLRGRHASHLALAAFLVLLLAYPGVKFVSQILLSPPA